MSLFQAWCQRTEFFWAFVFCRTPQIRTAKAKQQEKKKKREKKRRKGKKGKRKKGKSREEGYIFWPLNLIRIFKLRV